MIDVKNGKAITDIEKTARNISDNNPREFSFYLV
jgi:hypothetical protein